MTTDTPRALVGERVYSPTRALVGTIITRDPDAALVYVLWGNGPAASLEWEHAENVTPLFPRNRQEA